MDLLLNYVWGALSKKETMKANKMNFIHLIRQLSSRIEYCILCREDITFSILNSFTKTREHWSWSEVLSGGPRSAWQRYPGRRETSLGTSQLREGNSGDTSDTEIEIVLIIFIILMNF